MKTWFSIVTLVLFAFKGFSQADTLPTYAKHPLPQFKVALDANNSLFTEKDFPKGKNVMIMLFSPDCDHCKKETELIKENITKFKNTHILMVTSQPLDKMNEFVETYKLRDFKNITVGREDRHFFPIYFKIKYFPFLAIYDRKREFKKSFEGNAKLETLLPYLK